MAAVGEEEVFDQRSTGQSQRAVGQNAGAQHMPAVGAASQGIDHRVLLSLTAEAYGLRWPAMPRRFHPPLKVNTERPHDRLHRDPYGDTKPERLLSYNWSRPPA